MDKKELNKGNEVNLLDELKKFIFQMMVETNEDLISAGFTFDAYGEEDYTQPQCELLSALVAQENILRKLQQLQGIDNPSIMLGVELDARFQAKLNIMLEMVPPEKRDEMEKKLRAMDPQELEAAWEKVRVQFLEFKLKDIFTIINNGQEVSEYLRKHSTPEKEK